MQITAPRTTEIQWLERKIAQWIGSRYRRDQLTGELYYLGFHDILHRKRTMIGEGGNPVEVTNVPNEKIVDNLYADMVDVKSSYLLSQPVCFITENENFQKELDNFINADFLRKLKNVDQKALNNGIAWIYPYYNEDGNFKFKVFAGHEILPFWTSNEHDELEMVVRYYEREKRHSITDEIEKRIEVYTTQGIDHYILIGNKLFVDANNPHDDYFFDENKSYTWGDRIPMIPFKYNDKEQPLLNRCKSLQDAINVITSDFVNNMQEDPRNTILILENYDGSDLGEFRRNLATFGVVKVRSESGANGDVRALRIEVDSNNYNTVLSLLKQALIQNCRGYDTANLRLEGSPNQVQIKSVYQGLDLDANSTIVEYNWSLQKLFYFIKSYLKANGKGDYFDEKVKIIFNRDMLVSETEIMNTLVSAGVRISNRTLLEQVPFVNDVDKVLEELKQEEKELMDQLDPYNNQLNGSSRPKPKKTASAQFGGGNAS